MCSCQSKSIYKFRVPAMLRLSVLLLFVLTGQAFNSHAASPLPAIIEVTAKVGTTLNPGKLVALSRQYHIPPQSIYQWKNHLVVYSEPSHITGLYKQVTSLYPNATVKIYQRPFYYFERKYCSNATTAKAWDNIILTADLVKNTQLQQEYLNYHATQFKKWPEVAQGFCNANFQQLLVFKNGRQLMLVINIPKGENLDKLNPKTTENNPRVVQWNTIMKKYQEGLPGTKPGEVWVFLKPISK